MWTKKEDSILKEEISKSPNNLSNAFRNASKRLKGKSYATNSSVVNTKNGTAKLSKSSIPDKNSSKEELLEYARKHYPVGTEIKDVSHVRRVIPFSSKFKYGEVYENDIFVYNPNIRIYEYQLFDWATNKWAEIISLPEQTKPTQEVKPKQKGVFLDVNKLESLSIQSLRELAVTKLVDVDKKKLIDLIIE